MGDIGLVGVRFSTAGTWSRDEVPGRGKPLILCATEKVTDARWLAKALNLAYESEGAEFEAEERPRPQRPSAALAGFHLEREREAQKHPILRRILDDIGRLASQRDIVFFGVRDRRPLVDGPSTPTSTPPRPAASEQLGGGSEQQLGGGADGRPTDPIKMRVAVQRFNVSRGTLKRAVKDRELKSYRPKGAPKNAEHVFSERELGMRYERRG